MKFGFPWSVKDIRPEARETAREAARRAGLSVNEWLNTVILQQATTHGAHSPQPAGSAQNYSEVQSRLDELTRRMDQVTRSGPAAYAPRRGREEADQVADLIARLEQRFDQFAASRAIAMAPIANPQIPLGLDRAVAEISARRRALNGEAPPVQPQVIPALSPAPSAPSTPPQDLSGLEGELRRITSQIETLRRPGVEEAINALRAELGEISRTLNDALPRRAIETIEKQIQDLTQRIAENRQAGLDSGALTGVGQGLAEVCDALRGLTPAENLVGYTEAINALARKIDLIVAQQDPATMMQLENSITTLREMATHVASNETVKALAAQVQSLAEKVDYLALSGANSAVSKLERRIDEVARALAERAQSTDGPPTRLEMLMQSLSDKFEQMQQSRSDPVAFGHLEDRIVKLVERLDASNARLGHLEAIERGVSDLLVHIEDIRANRQPSALRAEDTAAIDTLKHDVARTQNTVEAMHGTLGQVVDRLAVIEKDIRGGQSPAASENDILELTQPAGNLGVGIVADAPAIVPQLPAAPPPQTLAPVAAPAPELRAPTPISNRVPPATAAQSNPELPPDQPLEPGSGPPRTSITGARIVASEAVLGGVRPHTATPGGKSSFIAAARRAAQAAQQDSKPRSSRSEAPKPGENASLRSKMMTRVKSLFIAASIVAIIVGSIQFAGNIFDFGFFDTKDAKFAQGLETEPLPGDDSGTIAEEEPETSSSLADNQLPSPPASGPATSDITAALLVPPALPGLTPATPATAPGITGIQSPSNLDQAPQGSSSLLNPQALSAPLLSVPSESKADVTGSVTRTPADARNNRQQQQTPPPPAAARLPASIGGPRLRNAALGGDANAAHEVATRFVEGRGVPANLEEAAHWYELAASKGLTPAQFRYASMLEKGQGVKKDLDSARKLYVAAASKGHAKAMHNLAVLYAEGVEGKPDYARAAQWFRKAAEHGVPDSQYNLGVLAARGIGIERNIAESYKWFALAAAQGDRDAGRKRDEVATQLDAQTLAGLQQAVKAFAAQQQPAEAITVPAPPGGWDRTMPASQEKPRAAGPLSISAFNSGKL